MDTPAEVASFFLVSRNGAVWSTHDTLARARTVAGEVARGTPKHEWYQGFDDQGRSAAVQRPVSVRVEELSARRGGGWDVIAYHSLWCAGEEVSGGLRAVSGSLVEIARRERGEGAPVRSIAHPVPPGNFQAPTNFRSA